MLHKIKIVNFRCYDAHEIDFRDLTIIVGKNNAGKSTMVEALKIISLSINRFLTSQKYEEHPSWIDLPKRAKGISPPLKNINFSSENLFHKYGSPPSTITAFFSNDIKITIYIEAVKSIFCTLSDLNDNYITSRSEAKKHIKTPVNALPQIFPLQREEKTLGTDYVKQNLSSDLSSLHFRNQIGLLPENFEKFKELSEQYWPGLRILKLESIRNFDNINLTLMIQDYDFVSEIGWMGHGLQMWLQIMWFIARIGEDSVVILDEPDVYMHPELQRKLIRLLKNRFKQVIVSTHSVEIISEVEPENILIIDKHRTKSIFASKVPVVQRILNSIGSIHNLQLTKLWASKKLIIVEGEDIAILKRFQNVIFPNSNEPFDSVPNFDIGGWGGWNYAKGSSMLLKNTVDNSLNIYCLFDSDYHTIEQKEQREKEAKDLNVYLHIWKRKEIENYLIVPNAIFRIIKKFGKNNADIKLADIEDVIKNKVLEFKDSVVNKIADEMNNQNKGRSIDTLIKLANKSIDNLEYRVSGKELISAIGQWSQQNFGVSLSPLKLVQNMELIDIDEEVIGFITDVENCKSVTAP